MGLLIFYSLSGDKIVFCKYSIFSELEITFLIEMLFFVRKYEPKGNKYVPLAFTESQQFLGVLQQMLYESLQTQ